MRPPITHENKHKTCALAALLLMPLVSALSIDPLSGSGPVPTPALLDTGPKLKAMVNSKKS